MILRLPFPPSTNRLWRIGGGRAHLSPEYRAFLQAAAATLPRERLDAPGFVVWIKAFPPDRRRRDVDNLAKAILDALTNCGVWKDDALVDDLRATMGEPASPPFVIVSITPNLNGRIKPNDSDSI